MIILKALIIAAMLLITAFSLNTIFENGRKVQVSEVVTTRTFTNAAFVAIAVITVAFDVLLAYLFTLV